MPNINRINATAPYGVLALDEDYSFHFSTDFDIDYAVSFIEDDMIKSGESYQIIISNINNKRSPRDIKLRDTITVILKEFFAVNNSALLYICETDDGKQAYRNRLFQMWLASTETSSWYICRSLSFIDNDGNMNFMSAILRNDNPNRTAIIAEFQEAFDLLSSKPV